MVSNGCDRFMPSCLAAPVDSEHIVVIVIVIVIVVIVMLLLLLLLLVCGYWFVVIGCYVELLLFGVDLDCDMQQV